VNRFTPLAIAMATASCGLFELFPDLALSDDASTDACDACTEDAEVVDASTEDAGGLVAYYRGSGADLSGNGHDAIWAGNILLGRDRFSNEDLAANLDGTSYLEVAMHPLLPINKAPRSVSVWVLSVDHHDGGTAASVWNWGRSGLSAQRFGLLIGQSEQAYFVGEYADIYGGPKLNDGRWHNVVVTFDGKNVAVYVDIALAAAATLNLDTVGQALEIGRSALDHLPEPFVGAIDEVRIYDRVISTAERRAIYFANGWK
jgi:Concanavalin A-like lectin/glucanases superfamily